MCLPPGPAGLALTVSWAGAAPPVAETESHAPVTVAVYMALPNRSPALSASREPVPGLRHKYQRRRVGDIRYTADHQRDRHNLCAAIRVGRVDGALICAYRQGLPDSPSHSDWRAARRISALSLHSPGASFQYWRLARYKYRSKAGWRAATPAPGVWFRQPCITNSREVGLAARVLAPTWRVTGMLERGRIRQ
jgi:hypothetical protein